MSPEAQKASARAMRNGELELDPAPCVRMRQSLPEPAWPEPGEQCRWPPMGISLARVVDDSRLLFIRKDYCRRLDALLLEPARGSRIFGGGVVDSVCFRGVPCVRSFCSVRLGFGILLRGNYDEE